MHCLYCGKALGFLRELTDGEFCCGQHRQRYKKLTKIALGRLLDAKAEITGQFPLDDPDLRAVARPRPVAPSLLLTPEGKRPRDRSGLFQPLPRPQPMPARLRTPAPEISREPVPTVPGFSLPVLEPVLGKAAPVWSRLDPILHHDSNKPLSAAVELAASRSAPRMGVLRNRVVREGAQPALRAADVASPSFFVPQPVTPALRPDHSTVTPALEFTAAAAMPFVAGIAAVQSLAAAQLASLELEAEASPAESLIARESVNALAFEGRAVWKKSPYWALGTIGVPVSTLADVDAPPLSVRPMVEAPRPQAALSRSGPVSELQSLPLEIQLRRAPALAVPSLRFGMAEARAHAGLARASAGNLTPAKGFEALATAARTVMPAMPVDASISLAAAEMVFLGLPKPEAKPAAAVAPGYLSVEIRKPAMAASGLFTANAGALLAALPVAGPAPMAASFAAPAAAMRETVVPQAMSVKVRMPALRAVPVRGTLAARGKVGEEVPAAGVAQQPVRHAATPLPAQGSVLPALASLFRYGRPSRTLPVINVPLEGIRPRKLAPVPLAFRELPMPIRAPHAPRSSQLRIVETFEYLRPLDEPEESLLDELLHLWRATPAYLRMAAASVCLILMLWFAAPGGRLTAVAENQWAGVRKSIESRAAVELLDDFQFGLVNWQGEGKWENSWSSDPAGFMRPGRLALFVPSLNMQDYRIEFLAQVEKQSVSWVYRASDGLNYYAAKLKVVKPGPLPEMALVRYAVINGQKEDLEQVPIRMILHKDRPYRVQVAVAGDSFTTSIEGQVVDFWRDSRLVKGGVGFFSEAGEKARVYWTKLSHQDDFVGRLCAYVYPNPIMIRSGK